MRSAEIAQRCEQRRKDQEMERVAQLQHEERREVERKARKALAAQKREERKVVR